MPNGGSDSCVSCWFNEVNAGNRETTGAKVPTSCKIRLFSIDDPWHTYCANHPKRRPDRDPIPIGPVFFGDDSVARSVGHPSPDNEETRLHLLQLLSEMKEEPSSEYPMGFYVDETIVYQLALFRDVRAVEHLHRIAAFDSEASERGPFKRTRRQLVQLARDALDMIESTSGS